jgi:hypothetical protein
VRALIVALAFLAFAVGAAGASDCSSTRDTIRQVESNGYVGAYSEGSYIPLPSVPSECRLAMADELAAYRSRTWQSLIGPQHSRYRHWLLWEEAQWAGRAQQFDRAAELTRLAKAEQHNQPDEYFDAFIAFFERDESALAEARQRLLRVVQQRYYSRPYGAGPGDALLAGAEGLQLCWERPFIDAHSLTCSGDPLTRIIRSRSN